MISPDINILMRNMDSRYTLVVATAKRARQLTAGAEPLTKFRSDKPVTLAIHEIAEGKVEYFRDAVKLPDKKYGDAAGFSKFGGQGAGLGGAGAGAYSTAIYDDEDGFTEDLTDSQLFGRNWRQDNRRDRNFTNSADAMPEDEAGLTDERYGPANMDYIDDEDAEIGDDDEL